MKKKVKDILGLMNSCVVSDFLGLSLTFLRILTFFTSLGILTWSYELDNKSYIQC